MFYHHIIKKCTKTYTEGDVFTTNENYWIITRSVNCQIWSKIVECPEDLSKEKLYDFEASRIQPGVEIKKHFATSIYNSFVGVGAIRYLSAHL